MNMFDIGARIRLASDMDIPSGVPTDLPFDITDYDKGGFLSDPNPIFLGSFRIPRTGLYLVGATLAWDGNVNGDRALTIMLREGPFYLSQDRKGPAPSGFASHHVSVLGQFAAGYHVGVQVYQNSGGLLKILPGTYPAMGYSFWIHELSAFHGE